MLHGILTRASPLKCARESNFPSSEIGEAGALCAGAHQTLSDVSIGHDVEVSQLEDTSGSPSFGVISEGWPIHRRWAR